MECTIWKKVGASVKMSFCTVNLSCQTQYNSIKTNVHGLIENFKLGKIGKKNFREKFRKFFFWYEKFLKICFSKKKFIKNKDYWWKNEFNS